jgi:hypothetical protein
MIARLVVAVLLAAVPSGLVHAGATSPTLVIASAFGIAGDARRTVVLETSWDYPNGVQVPYPLEIVVFQGPRFVRYPIHGAAVAGTSALLADGRLDAADLPGLLGAGAPAPGDVRIVTLTAGEARVALPAEFAAGVATAVLFATLPEHDVFSNPLTLVLP